MVSLNDQGQPPDRSPEFRPPPLPTPDPSGLTIGGFEVIRLLGQGAMGKVYLARQPGLNRHVALKVLPSELLLNESAVSRFSREARAAARLDHPNIVGVIDAGWDAATRHRFIAFELVDGPSLQELLDRVGRFSERDTLRVGLGITKALCYARKVNLVHRDLKPENVLLDSSGTPRVADLGLAKILDEHSSITKTGIAVGTPHYMAPEQAIDSRNVDIRSDLYALGLMLYRMSTGQVPLDADSAYEVLARHVKDDCPNPRLEAPNLSKGFCLLVGQLTARKREDRLQTPEETAERITRLLSSDPEDVTPHPQWTPPWELKRKRRTQLVAAGAMLGLAVVVAWLILHQPGRHPASSPDRSAAEQPARATATKKPEPSRPVSLPPAHPGWDLRWSLVAGRPPQLHSPALWETGLGVIAYPLRGVREDDPEALAAAFDGTVERLGENRVRVTYFINRAARVRVQQPGQFFFNGRPNAAIPRAGEVYQGDRSLLIDVPNDTGPIEVRIGHARWTNSRLSLQARLTPVDLTALSIRLHREPGGRLTLEGRRKVVRLEGRSIPLRPVNSWHQVVFAPSAALGERVQIDGKTPSTLDAKARGSTANAIAEPTLVLKEGIFSISKLAVEGLPRSTDVAATAIAPPELGAAARITAAFQRKGPGLGGPFVALGRAGGDQIRLELDMGRLILRHGATVLRAQSSASLAPERVELLLERREDLLIARATIDDEELQIETEEPLPLRAHPVQALYGSTGPKLRILAVEVHQGPPSTGRDAFDSMHASGETVLTTREQESAPLDDPWATWRQGALNLAAVTRLTWARHDQIGQEGFHSRIEIAKDAASQLRSAARRLPRESARLDALARALLAETLAVRPHATKQLAEELIATAGLDKAQAAVDWLETEGHEPRLLKHLAEGYIQSDRAPRIAMAALQGVRPLAPDLAPTIDYYQALVLLQFAKTGGSRAALYRRDALQLLAKARRAGNDDSNLMLNLARVLTELGKLPEALQSWERGLAREPQNHWAWRNYSRALNRAGKPREALKAAIGALAFAQDQLSSQQLVENMVLQFNGKHQRRHNLGLLSAAVVSLKAAKANPALLTRLERFLEGVPWDTRPQDQLESDLQIYVLMRLGKRVNLPKQQTRPILALALARHLQANDPEVAGQLLRDAANSEPLVAHLARLDPLLADLLDD